MKIHLAPLLLLIFSSSIFAEELQIIEYPSRSSPIVLVDLRGTSEENKAFILEAFKNLETTATKHRQNFGPDSSYIKIVIASGSEKIEASSWHPLYEESPNTVATSTGLQALNGRNREEVLSNEPETYQHFRRIFDSILTRAKSIAEQGAAANP